MFATSRIGNDNRACTGQARAHPRPLTIRFEKPTAWSGRASGQPGRSRQSTGGVERRTPTADVLVANDFEDAHDSVWWRWQ